MIRFLFFPMLLIIAFPLLAEESKKAEALNPGINYYSAGDYKRAVKAFEQSIRLHPDNAEAYKWLGMNYLKLGDNEVLTDPAMLYKAVEAFNRALSLNPNFAEVRYNLGITYLALHNRDEAIKECELLKNLDMELANSLSTRIGDYKSPQLYSALGETDSYVLKVTIIGNQVLVPVTLAYGGKSVQTTLLLDTGASGTTINPEIADKLDINPARARISIEQVVGGGLIKGRRIKLDYIKVGPHTKKDIEVDIIEHKGFAVRFSGLLGMNFLRNLRYHVDFADQTITWTP